MLTADTITDEQINELMRDAVQRGQYLLVERCALALAKPSTKRRGAVRVARARCAEILNARNQKAR